MNCKRKLTSALALVGALLTFSIPAARAQIMLSKKDTIYLETGVLKFRRNIAYEPNQVDLLRMVIVKEFSGKAKFYAGLSSELAIRKEWLTDSYESRDTIELDAEPSRISSYGSFMISLKKMSYRDCVSLVNDKATISHFDDVWLNDEVISRAPRAGESVCIREWPIQAGKNIFKYHAH